MREYTTAAGSMPLTRNTATPTTVTEPVYSVIVENAVCAVKVHTVGLAELTRTAGKKTAVFNIVAVGIAVGVPHK